MELSGMFQNYRPSHTFLAWERLFKFLYYLQFSVNLILYSVFGE